MGPSHVPRFCSEPSDSPVTSWNELEYFTTDNHCTDFVGWFSLLSQLAQDYPHIVAVGIDDFLSPDNLSTFTPGYVAELQSRLRWPSEWLSFVPTVYYEYFRNGQRFPDLDKARVAAFHLVHGIRGHSLCGSKGYNAFAPCSSHRTTCGGLPQARSHWPSGAGVAQP